MLTKHIFNYLRSLADFIGLIAYSIRSSDLLKLSGYFLRFWRYKLLQFSIFSSVWRSYVVTCIENLRFYTSKNYEKRSTVSVIKVFYFCEWQQSYKPILIPHIIFYSAYIDWTSRREDDQISKRKDWTSRNRPCN